MSIAGRHGWEQGAGGEKEGHPTAPPPSLTPPHSFFPHDLWYDMRQEVSKALAVTKKGITQVQNQLEEFISADTAAAEMVQVT